MEEEVVQWPVGVQRPSMPRRPDSRVYIELEDHICSIFSRERVPREHFRGIKDDPHLFDI